MFEHARAALATVELPDPTDAGVTAVQDHAVVTDRPTLARRREVHGDQVRADRHLGLAPFAAGIVGIKDVATLTHCDQAPTGASQTSEHALRSLFTLDRWTVQGIGEFRRHGGPGER
ncbi:hypothetical protein D3C80_1084890 [compost metagenome]